MNLTKTCLIGFGMAIIGGCSTSPIPVSENFPLTVQPKVRSAGHWNILSKDIVSQTLQTLNKIDAVSGLHVKNPVNASAFDKSFKEFLITELVKSGRVVKQDPNNNLLEVSYQAQIVKHRGDRPWHIPGGLTMLTTGMYALYGIGAETAGLALLGVAGAADTLQSINSGGPTHTEMILTTTVTKDGQYMSRKTDIYYVEDIDSDLFQFEPNKVKLFNVVG